MAKKLTPAELRAEQRSDPRLVYQGPPCEYCKHLTEMGTQSSFEGWICKAFPDGIPRMILRRDAKHDDPGLWGQEGEYVFESKVYDFYNGPDTISFEGDWASWAKRRK